MKRVFLSLWIIVAFIVFLEGCKEKNEVRFTDADRLAILQTLSDQENAWNEGNVEKFMEGYWKSDSMQFIGSKGINFGWQTTLNNYKKNFPDTVAMGKLRFDILKVNSVSADAAFLTGKFYLKRSIGDMNGIFTLVLRKIDGRWVVVYDHTSD